MTSHTRIDAELLGLRRQAMPETALDQRPATPTQSVAELTKVPQPIIWLAYMKHRLATTCSALVLPLLFTATGAAMADSQPVRMNTNITEQQVLKAQQGWCNGLLAISKAYATGGFAAAETTASKILDQAYAYQYGAVAFKPTLTQQPQTFRGTKAGALAYFVGGNPSYPNDKGFAIKPWQKCAIRNQVVQFHGDLAITMGNVDLTDSSGKVTTVDKTWAFVRERDGEVRIVLHHSSLPFTAK